MGYNVYNLRSGGGGGSYRQKSNLDEFEEAAMMAKEGLEIMCELAEEMKEQFGSRERRGGGQSGNRGGGSSGNRGGYGSRENYREREEWDDDDEMNMRERRRRDRMGRFM